MVLDSFVKIIGMSIFKNLFCDLVSIPKTNSNIYISFETTGVFASECVEI
jgi:hypothetical protein